MIRVRERRGDTLQSLGWPNQALQRTSTAVATSASPDQRGLSAPDAGGVRSTLSLETALAVGRLLLNYVLSDPYVDVATVGGREPRLREPRFVELNNEISDDIASHIDLAALHDRYVR